MAVAERYGLDPVLGHIMILPKSQRPYITRDGYLHIAHRSGQLDGIEVTDGPRRDGAEREWTAKIAVWRKDMGRPFTFPGRAALTLDNGPEMSLARAERRALKRAFDVTLPQSFAEDEFDERPLPAQLVPPGPGDGGASPAAVPEQGQVPAALATVSKGTLRALQAAFKEAGDTRARRLERLTEWTGRKIASASDLTEEEAAEALSRLRDAAAPDGPDDGDPGASPPATPDTRNRLISVLNGAGITAKDDVLDLLSDWADRRIGGTGDLTEYEAQVALANAAQLTPVPGDGNEAER
ncbi:MAG: recombinase RecT [Actinomycetia bacterium]|nr:recombinase RecT [Actinomycetes bacterium]